MLHFLQNLPLLPLGLPLYLILGVLLLAAAGAPLWYDRRLPRSSQSSYVVSPYVIIWILAVGLLALIWWQLLISALAIGVAGWFVTRQRHPSHDAQAHDMDTWLDEVADYYEQARQAGQARLDAIAQSGDTLLLSSLVDERRWSSEMLDIRFGMQEYVEDLLESEGIVEDEDFVLGRRLETVFVVWHHMILDNSLRNLGIELDLKDWSLSELTSDDLSPADPQLRDLAVLLGKRSYATTASYRHWVIDTSARWASLNSTTQDQMDDLWEVHQQWIGSSITLVVGETVTGQSKPVSPEPPGPVDPSQFLQW